MKNFSQPGSIEESSTSEVSIERCLNGDQSAWERLVNSHTTLIYSLCFRYARRDCEARDIMQDVFVRIFQELRGFRRNEGSFKGWIIRVTRNLIVDHYRRSRRHAMNEPLSSWLEQIESTANQGYLPERTVQGKQDMASLHKALSKLAPERRRIIVLRELEELEYSEIAALLAIPEGTVKSRLNRTRAELSRLLKQAGLTLAPSTARLSTGS